MLHAKKFLFILPRDVLQASRDWASMSSDDDRRRPVRA